MKMYKYVIVFLVGIFLIMACRNNNEDQETIKTNTSVSDKHQKDKKIARMAQDMATMQNAPLASALTVDANKKKAIEMASKATQNLKSYQQFHGRNLEVLEVFEGRCVGCWVINLAFDLQSDKDINRTDSATVKVSINSWQVKDVVYARRSQNIFSITECRQLGGRVLLSVNKTLCGEEEKIIGGVKPFDQPALCCQPEFMAQPAPHVPETSEDNTDL